MTMLTPVSERAIILAPLGRDGSLALMMLNEAGYSGVIATDLSMLCDVLEGGCGLLIIAAEALRGVDLEPLLDHLHQQPAWSDLPIVLMTHHGGSEQNGSSHLSGLLGNVTFLERPFHPVTLISLVSTALRGRRRQYDARDRLVDLSESELRLQRTLETLEQQVEERTAQLRHNEDALRQSQKMEAVGQLTGGIAHDFNNMLTGIIGSLELLRRRVSRGKLDDLDSLIDLGVTSANRAAGLTHRLLAFSRRQSLDSKPVEINQLVTAISRPQPTGKRPAQLGDQRTGRHAQRWPTGGGNQQPPSGQRFHCRLWHVETGRLRGAERQRHGLRYPAKRDGPGIRPVFYDQTHRPGHRPRAIDDLRLCPPVPRPRHPPQ